MKFVLSFFILITALLCQCCHGYRSKGAAIAADARGRIGSVSYPFSDSFWEYVTGNRYKGHLFVSDVLKDVGVRYPRRKLPAEPIYAEEWANPRSPRINILSMCWRSCPGNPLNGDVIAYDGIVGIVTGNNKITYSDPSADPPGLVVEVQSKYEERKKGVCWRYIC